MSSTRELIKESVFNYYAKNWIELLELTILINSEMSFFSFKSEYEKEFSVKFSDATNFNQLLSLI